jgi:hypothetical protein
VLLNFCEVGQSLLLHNWPSEQLFRGLQGRILSPRTTRIGFTVTRWTGVGLLEAEKKFRKVRLQGSGSPPTLTESVLDSSATGG